MASITIKLAQAVLGGSGEYSYEISDLKALTMIEELIKEKKLALGAEAPTKQKAGKKAKAASPASAKPSKKAKGAKKSGKRAPKGENQAKVLEAVKASPEGTSPAAISKATGIHVVTVAQILKKLTKEGVLENPSKGLYKIK